MAIIAGEDIWGVPNEQVRQTWWGVLVELTRNIAEGFLEALSLWGSCASLCA